MLKKKPESIIVGRYKGRPLYVNGAYHVIMVSPTRSGKTTCVAVPVLLTYEHSVVCLDVKGELLSSPVGSAPRWDRRSSYGRRTTNRVARIASIRWP